jgi:steroid delta-isomerase-like uncharacterized protein
MRQQTEELIRRYYTAFNARNWDDMIVCLADDVVHDINQGGRHVGKGHFSSFLAHMDRCYREELKDIAILSSPDGARAAAEFVVHGKYLATDEGLPPARGQGYVLQAGAFFDVKNGKITRVSTHYNLKDWIAQVGG